MHSLLAFQVNFGQQKLVKKYSKKGSYSPHGVKRGCDIFQDKMIINIAFLENLFPLDHTIKHKCYNRLNNGDIGCLHALKVLQVKISLLLIFLSFLRILYEFQQLVRHHEEINLDKALIIKEVVIIEQIFLLL